MKNICFLIGCIDNSGGTERICCQLANALAKTSNYNTYIVSHQLITGNPFFKIDSRISVEYLRKTALAKSKNLLKKLFSLFGLNSRLKKFFKFNKIDVVFVIDVIQFAYLPVLSKNKSIKTIACEHSNSFFDGSKTLHGTYARKQAASHANLLVTLTERDRENYKKRFRVKTKIITIPNAIEDSFFLSNTNSKKEKVLLTVGALNYSKGFEYLIAVADILFNEYKMTDWKWIIVGDGELKDTLINEIKHRNLQDNLILAGKVENVASFYSKSQILVVTSRYEGLPLSIIEGQCCGLPVVSFDCNCGPSELIENEKNGFLIKNYDCKKMADKLKMLIKDNKLRTQFASNASINSSQFMEKNIIPKWIEIIEKKL